MFFNNGITIGNRFGSLTLAGSVLVSTETVNITLPNNSFRFVGSKGDAFIRLATPIPTGTTTTLPVVLVCNGVTLPLTTTSGAAVTAADLGQTNLLHVFIDKQANTVQLINQNI